MRRDLLNGNILKGIILLAMPIMGTSFLQMAYNMVDMIWIGKLGPEAVAAIGTAGFFVWFSLSLVRLIQTGTSVEVAQKVGAGDFDDAKRYASVSLTLAIIIGIIYGIILFLTKDYLVLFFKLGDSVVESNASGYLGVISMGMIFTFVNPIVSSVYNGAGYSKLPFYVNATGLILNIILDPVFIFVFKLGVRGAAYATILSQGIVMVVLLMMLLYKSKPFEGFSYVPGIDFKHVKDIAALGLPVAIQSGLFTIFAMFLARVVAAYGAEAIAAQKVGVQIESISYMTAHGFAQALSAFTGQNYGAKQYKRVNKGIRTAGGLMLGFGFLITVLMYTYSEQIFSIFITDPGTVEIGIKYLRILALSQMFMAVEIAMAGAFNGLGKTKPPAIMSIIFTGARVPFAYLLARESLLGLDGVWWTVTGTSVVKGTIMMVMILVLMNQMRKMYLKEDILV